MRSLLLIALVGCSGDAGTGKGTGPGDDDDDDDTTPAPACLSEPYGAGTSPLPADDPTSGTCTFAASDPVTIERVDVTCDGTAFSILVETSLWTGNGRAVVVTDAGDTEVPLYSQEFSECGYWDRLAADEATGCDADLGCATFVLEVDNLDGTPVDCVVFGPEADALLDGSRTLTGSSVDLGTCRPMSG